MSDSTISRLWQRLQAAIAPGRIFLTDDTGPVQTGQMRTGPDELIDGVPIVRHFGFASNPPADTLGVAIFANGDRNSGVIFATNHPASRLKDLQPGEAAIYDDQGRWVWLKAGGIEIEANGAPVLIKGASTATIEASTKVVLDTPLVECTGDVVADGISLKTHVHGGVTAGGATTGAPQ